ncbi:MAG TPA: site-specific integrase [Verrucomicrobiae bacterium]
MRVRRYALRTERTFCAWIRRYVKFHGMRSREDLTEGTRKVEAFLTHLAVEGNVAPLRQCRLVPRAPLPCLHHDPFRFRLRHFPHRLPAMALPRSPRPPRQQFWFRGLRPEKPAPANRFVFPARVRPAPPPQEGFQSPPSRHAVLRKRIFPPATGPSAARPAVVPAASNTPANCSTGRPAAALPAGASWPGPGSNAPRRTPSANARCRCRPQPTPDGGH